MGTGIDFARKNRGLLILCLLLSLFLGGCATRQGQWRSEASADKDDCRRFWLNMEQQLHDHQVVDAGTVRLPSFPYLRTNRFLQGLAAQATTDRERGQVLEEMRLLDLERRLPELRRLPAEVLSSLAPDTMPDGNSLEQLVPRCSARLLAEDGKRPQLWREVEQGLGLDRDYSLWLRGLGLYPLTGLVVNHVAQRAQEEMVDRLREPVTESAPRITLRPAVGIGPVEAAEPRAVLRAARRPPLLTFGRRDPQLIALVERFAPLFSVAGQAPYDRFGRVVKDRHGFAVDGADPVVYYYLSQTFVQSVPALQINYLIWFNERAEPAPWFEQGDLDGLVFRVTLGWHGRPVFVDVAFHCGCYHFVMAADDFVKGPRLDGKAFQPTYAGAMPPASAANRLHFQIGSGWHQLDRVATAEAAVEYATYRLRPYEDLESFRHNGEIVSLFNSAGLVPGSERLERFFLFPMGIPKVGSLRQRGRQPITLVGRAYFDDPFLFDRAFHYRTAPPERSELTAPTPARRRAQE